MSQTPLAGLYQNLQSPPRCQRTRYLLLPALCLFVACPVERTRPKDADELSLPLLLAREATAAADEE